MENLRFEESFREAFDGAGIAPSAAVWTNVELGLEKNSGGKMRGRLIFFQLLAAASMVFAMGIGSVYFLNTSIDSTQPIAHQELNNTVPNQSVIDNNSSIDRNKINSVKNNGQPKLTSENIGKSENELVLDIPRQAHNETNEEVSLISGKRTLPKLVEVTEPSLNIPTHEPDAGMVLLAKLKDEEKKFQKDKPNLKEKLWAALGMGAGTYNPNSSSSDKLYGLSTTNSPSSSTSSPASGTSYSIGVSVATKVSPRVVLQGGISYLSQNSTYTSNIASGSGAALLNDYATIRKDEALSIDDQIMVTSPYQVSNNLQYMSIPLQAGYIIIDQTFALQVNGGISTDIFFRNTLTPENSDLDEVTRGGGSDSPYRTLNFSGLLGTELSYKVGDHYRIAVNPGMRYALNSIYKDEIAAETSPLTFDVALRFRYMF